MMRMFAVAIFGLALIGLTQPSSAQDTSPGMQQPQNVQPGMPAGLLPGSYSQQSPPARGSEEPTVPGGDHTASAAPASAETQAPMPGNSSGNGMVLGGSDASAALPEMQVPQRPGEGKGTLQ